MTVSAQTPLEQSKTLIVFFSQTGHTRAVGKIIQELTGGSVLELIASVPYPNDYHAIRVRAKSEQEKDVRPSLRFLPSSIESYDTIFVGSPIWNYTIAQPVATFLGQYDFKDKIVIPFCTHGGGGAGHSVGDIQKRIPTALVFEGYACVGGRIDKDNIRKWLQRIGVK